MADGLTDYRRKRRFPDTPEPSGDPVSAVDGTDRDRAARDGGRTDGGGDPRFVVHEHHATRLHWDLRLEHDGVLASFAIPNGLPTDPHQNRKAVHTEDHPLEYVDFRGTIPEGNYGAGEMSIWDHGTYACEKWREDELIVVFAGERLTGRYALFRAGKDPKDWMIHRMDPPEDAAAEPFPDELPPMLARAGTLPREESSWAFEVKWDGVRATVRSQPGRLHLLSRAGNDITAGYPELRALNAALSSHEAILDGEIVAFDDDGRPSFQALQSRMHARGAHVKRLATERPVTLMLFDLLWLDGHALTGLPWEERRARLEDLGLDGPHWQTPPAHVGRGSDLLAATAAQGLEGVIAKRLDAPYRPGRRSDAWLKVKNEQRQEFVIGGWLPGKGGRSGVLGSLQLGVHDRDGVLRYAGGVGTGFDRATLEDLTAKLGRLERKTSPFVGRQPPREARFATPRLVCEVRFAEWTSDASIRQGVYQGLRDDKDAEDVVRELPPGTAADGADADGGATTTGSSRGHGSSAAAEPSTAGGSSAAAESSTAGGSSGPKRKAVPKPSPAPTGTPVDLASAAEVADRIPDAGKALELEVDGRTLKLSNLDKVLYPDGTTKADVLRYYARIAPAILPHLHDRPVTLKRYPDGVDGKAFYEKHANRHRPDWVRTTAVPHTRKEGTIDFVLVQDVPTLLWAANLAALELHPSLSLAAPRRKAGVTGPRSVVFDLDPGPGTTIVECCRVGLAIRDLLDELGLRSFAKTSGSKGLQLYAPLNTDVAYDRSKPFAHAVAALMEQREPELVVSQMKKTLRDGKVLIDWSQNDEHKTTVGVYSLRAKDRPTASTPVTWDEVAACERSGDPEDLVFLADDVVARVASGGDGFGPLLQLEQELPQLGG